MNRLAFELALLAFLSPELGEIRSVIDVRDPGELDSDQHRARPRLTRRHGVLHRLGIRQAWQQRALGSTYAASRRAPRARQSAACPLDHVPRQVQRKRVDADLRRHSDARREERAIGDEETA